MIEKHTYVQIYQTILRPKERAKNIPEDTQRVPLEMRIKGYLLEDAKIGDLVEVRTATGRIESGVLLVAEPNFTHSFGRHLKVIDKVRAIIKSETEDI